MKALRQSKLVLGFSDVICFLLSLSICLILQKLYMGGVLLKDFPHEYNLVHRKLIVFLSRNFGKCKMTFTFWNAQSLLNLLLNLHHIQPWTWYTTGKTSEFLYPYHIILWSHCSFCLFCFPFNWETWIVTPPSLACSWNLFKISIIKLFLDDLIFSS